MEMIKYEISFDIMSFMRYYLIRRHLKECYNNKYHLIKSEILFDSTSFDGTSLDEASLDKTSPKWFQQTWLKR